MTNTVSAVPKVPIVPCVRDQSRFGQFAKKIELVKRHNTVFALTIGTAGTIGTFGTAPESEL
jgi:hypothetical protein